MDRSNLGIQGRASKAAILPVTSVAAAADLDLGKDLLLLSIATKVVGLIHLEDERLSGMQGWLLQVEDVETLIMMDAPAQHKAALGEEGVWVHAFQLREGDLDCKGRVLQVVVPVLPLIEDTEDPLCYLTPDY